MLRLKQNTNYINLTAHEIEALRTTYNLADAHTHQSQNACQNKIVKSLPDLWFEAEKKPQAYFEKKFLKTFFLSQHQQTAFELNRSMLFYASSVAILAVANYLRVTNKSTTLVEPSFDNVADLLKDHRVELKAFNQNLLRRNIYDNLSEHIQTDVVFLIDPINPTGFTLLPEEKNFSEVIRFCKDNSKLLILDLCFAPFANIYFEKGRFDLYKLLEESGVDYITIEDTGKLLPTQDVKCAILTCSESVYENLYKIQTDILLNVSPFVLNLLIAYVESAVAENFKSYKELWTTNINYLKEKIQNTSLELVESNSLVSVCWLRFKSEKTDKMEFIDQLKRVGVYVLPGEYFYWENNELGEDYLRIALARDNEYFFKAIDELVKVLKTT